MQHIKLWAALIHKRKEEARHVTVTFIWGLWLVLPYKTFVSSISFREMMKVAPEQVWGVAIMAIALLHLGAIVRGNLWQRRIFCYITAGLWVYLTVLFFLSNPGSTAVPIYGMTALFSLWTAMHLFNGKAV